MNRSRGEGSNEVTEVVEMVLLILLASEAADVLGMDAGPRTPDMLKSVVLLFVIAISSPIRDPGKMKWGEPPPQRERESLSMSGKIVSQSNPTVEISGTSRETTVSAASGRCIPLRGSVGWSINWGAGTRLCPAESAQAEVRAHQFLHTSTN